MSKKRNHIIDALSEVHDLVECFPDGVLYLVSQYDDGESHTKRNAGEVASGHIDSLINQLVELQSEIKKKYK